MQNAACSSSVCEPRTAAPAASASIKPAKLDCCFSEMCWGKLAERTHSFSARGKQKAPGHCCIYVKTSNYSLSLRTFGLEPHWEHLAWSRGAFLAPREKLFPSVSLQVPVAGKYFCGAVASRFFLEGERSAICTLTWHGHRVLTHCRVWLMDSQIQVVSDCWFLVT